MKENERNQQQTSTDSMQNQDSNSRQTQNTSGQGEQDQNSQDGSKWSNYRTRELSDEGSGEGNATTPGNA